MKNNTPAEGPMEFLSMHQGTSWMSVIRIPIALIIFMLVMGFSIYLLGNLFRDILGFELVVLGSFFFALFAVIKVLSRILPVVPLERLRFLLDEEEMEWTFDLKGQKTIRTFSIRDGLIKDSRFDYVDIVTTDGDAYTLHKNWIPTSEISEGDVSYCELCIVDNCFALHGLKRRGSKSAPVYTRLFYADGRIGEKPDDLS